MFAPDVAGQGYATEAARALVDLAFGELGVRRVWAQLEPENTRSARVCERLGMRREALFVQGSWFKGRWSDLAIYALLADEWAARRPSDVDGWPLSADAAPVVDGGSAYFAATADTWSVVVARG